MIKFINNLLTRRILKKHAIAFSEWNDVISKIPMLSGLSSVEKARLRKLTTLFLSKKHIVGAHDLNITQTMRLTIASQACLQILNLGIDSFNGWVEIIVYPGAFKVSRTVTSEDGLVHQKINHLSGEAWDKGPLILSWEDVSSESYLLHSGQNVVIHEFAHKLDMLNGRANGMPPLHPNMTIEDWSETLSKAYELLNKKLDNFQHSSINPYASTNPGEFFAVISEYFFTAPHILFEFCPDVYEQLKQYYRQNTLQRYN
ncbi:MAG: zinc-dependent peptidase [Gammaproteobacteria bacterium]|nr:zinc-dependent peptidase [Gammaproteobacteria bacterium]